MRAIRREGQSFEPQLAKLRKGSPKQDFNGKKIQGKDLAHFRFDAGGGRIEDDFETLYGAEPNNILILFNNEIDDVWMTAYEDYDARGNVKQRHDGQRVYNWMDAQGIKYASDFEGNPYTKYKNYIVVPPNKAPLINDKAKQVGRLTFTVFGLGRSFGVICFETHSINDILMIEDNLTQATSRFGTLKNIPFILSRGLRKISTPDTDRQGKKQSEKRVIREKSLIMVGVHPDRFMQWEAQQRIKLGLRNVPIALLETRTIDPDTGEIRGDGAPTSDVLEMDVDFMDDGDDEEEIVEASYREAQPAAVKIQPPSPSPAPAVPSPTTDLETVAFSAMGPNWATKKAEILAVWADQADLAESIASSKRAWTMFGMTRGAMPLPDSAKAPQAEPTAQDVLDDQKIAV